MQQPLFWTLKENWGDNMTLDNMKKSLKQLPLSVPMAASAVMTAASLAGKNKQLHFWSGVCWLGLSAVHTWQHCTKVKNDIQKGVKKMGIMDFVNIPKNKIDMFIRTVEVAAYVPGRVRLYSKQLIGNPVNCRKVKDYLRSYKELSEVEVNEVTGSILIKYTPQLLHTNKELTKVEEYIKTHVRR